MFRLDRESHRALAALNSSYRLSFLNPAGGNPALISVEIIDLTTGKVYSSSKFPADTHDERAAVIAAIKVAQGGERPKTPAQLAEENANLRKELADAKAAIASASVSGAPTANSQSSTGGGDGMVIASKPSDSTIAIADDDDDDEVEYTGEPLDALTPSDLATAMKLRGLAVPSGDRRTGEWKATAIAAIESHDAAQ